MVLKYLSTFLTVILTSISSLSAPIGDSYTISLPLHIDLSDSGSFNVELVDSSLTDNDSIEICFDDSFVLSDIHGKPDIYGSVSNNYVSFSPDDQSTKSVYYSIQDPGVGQWRGNLNVSISVNRTAQSNILIDGNSINEILSQLSFNTISFSHDSISGDYLYDLSTAQDESILLYKNGNEVIITNAKDEPIIANEDMSCLFRNLKVTSINHLDYIDMSTCTNMARMFEWDDKLLSLDVSSFNTSNVTDMSYMFENMQACTSITGLENFDVSNVTSISHLLSYCYALSSVPNLGSWNITDKCTDISYAFNCVGYTISKTNTSKWNDSITYDYSNWDVSNVTDMSYAFANAFKLKNINLSGWDTSNVTNMAGMFEMRDTINKSLLVSVNGVENFDISNVTNISNMFYECRNLVADLSTWNPISVLDITYTFYDTRYLDIRCLENWSDIIINNSVNYSNCFSNNTGYYVQKNWKPSWYK